MASVSVACTRVSDLQDYVWLPASVSVASRRVGQSCIFGSSSPPFRGVDKCPSREGTFTEEIPWWAYTKCVICDVALACMGVYVCACAPLKRSLARR